ncbi:MAG: hypothetical protein IPK39_24310 [Sulfuritalea sp.]|nr:hypothetical protein [Sulfuritalea sp.]
MADVGRTGQQFGGRHGRPPAAPVTVAPKQPQSGPVITAVRALEASTPPWQRAVARLAPHGDQRLTGQGRLELPPEHRRQGIAAVPALQKRTEHVADPAVAGHDHIHEFAAEAYLGLLRKRSNRFSALQMTECYHLGGISRKPAPSWVMV